MAPAAWVLVCALDLLGRSAQQLPPIRIVEARPAGVSANADAFVDHREGGVIYLIASAPAFRTARAAQSAPAECRAREALQMVASIIAHEEWHVKHGSDERGAYLAQLTTLQQLGSGPGRWPYASVTRAMQAVVGAQARRGRPQTLASSR